MTSFPATPAGLPFQPGFAGTMPVGAVIAFAGSLSQPEDHGPDNTDRLEALGWMLCDGRTLAASQYPVLFAVLGYGYGGADGRFRIPDYRGSWLNGTASPDSPPAAQEPAGPRPVNRAVNYLIRFIS